MATSSTTVITKKGENLYKIGGKKMVTVSRWRDVTLVHIREYDGEEPNVFPTKRGLVLTPAEFKALVALTKTVQHDVEQKTSGPSSSMPQQQPRQPPRSYTHLAAERWAAWTTHGHRGLNTTKERKMRWVTENFKPRFRNVDAPRLQSWTTTFSILIHKCFKA